MNIAPLFADAEHHPLLITPQGNSSRDALCDYGVTHRSHIEQMLCHHGAILFRGFRIEGASGFKSCVESFGAEPFGYVGGNSPRRVVLQDVYTSTEYPASERISLHNEMSYSPSWPRRLFFCSLQPAASGGQTSLASSRDVLRAVPDAIVARLAAKGITYIRNFSPGFRLGKSWQDTYGTQNRSQVEAMAAETGSTCAWLPDGALRVSTRCEALVRHPQTAEQVWFNQGEQWHPSALDPDLRTMLEETLGKDGLPHDCRYGDGEPIEEQALVHIRRSQESCKLLFDWQADDLLVLDNVLIMHGREAFTGERKTLAYLSST